MCYARIKTSHYQLLKANLNHECQPSFKKRIKKSNTYKEPKTINNIYEVLQAAKEIIDTMQKEYLIDPHKELKRTIERYKKFISSIENGAPKRSLIFGLSRRYIEAGLDYRNPILDTMYDIQEYMYKEIS